MEGGEPGGPLRRKKRKIGARQKDQSPPKIPDDGSLLTATNPQVDYPDFLCLASLIMERDIPIIFHGSVRPKNTHGMVGAGGSFLAFTDARTVDDAINPREIKALTDGVVLKRTRAASVSSSNVLTANAVRYASILAELQILTHPAIVDHQNFIQFLGLTWDFEPGDGHKPSVWPVLGLEEAMFPMNLLHSKIDQSSPSLAIKFCHGVAKAIDFLHTCSVAHCDIKSENVLVCWDEHFGYTAKLSDFGSVVLNVTSETSLPQGIVGTRPWNAPEYSKRLSGFDVLKTDVFSFGMLIWRSLTRSGILVEVDEVSEGERKSIIQKLETMKNANKLINLALDEVRRSYGGLHGTELICQTLERSLELNPSDRATISDLVIILESLNDRDDSDEAERNIVEDNEKETSDSGLTQDTGSEETEWIAPIPDVPFYSDKFDMIYAKFQDEAPPVKKELVECLTRWATRHSEHEFDAGEAAYQLSTCYFNGFGVEPNLDRGLRWILRAARLGSQKARSQAFGVCKSVGRKDQVDREELLIWLEETAKLGSQQAAEGLRDLDPARYQNANSSWLRRFCNVDADTGLPEIPDESDLTRYLERLGSLDELDSTMLNSRGYRLLHLASSLGYRSVVTTLIKQGADVNISNNEGETPLLCACQAGQYSTALLLLEKGADVGCSDYGISPLHWLIEIRAEDVKSLANELTSRGALLEQQVTATEQNDYPFDAFPHGTPLDWAISMRNKAGTQALVDLGADPFNNCSGQSPVVKAVSLHDVDLVRILLQSQHATAERVNALDEDGQSILFHALYCNQPFERLLAHGNKHRDYARDTIQLLLDFGCDPSRIDSDGGSVLHTAGFCELAILQMLIDDLEMAKFINTHRGPRGAYPIHQAAVSHRLDVFKLLISRGADAFSCLSNGHTVLHICAAIDEEDRSVAILNELDLHGRPDLDDTGVTEGSEPGFTALELAVRSGNFKIAKLLLDNGASPVGPKREFSLLLYLINDPVWFSPQTLQFYIDNCSHDFIVKRKGQISALHAAASLTSLAHPGDALTSEAKLDILLSQFPGPQYLEARTCAAPEDEVVGGQTPLHHAAKFGVYFAVWRLLKAGADPSATDEQGRTPLDLAKQSLEYINNLVLPDEVPHIYKDIESTVDILKRAVCKEELLPRQAASFAHYNSLHFSRLGFKTDN